MEAGAREVEARFLGPVAGILVITAEAQTSVSEDEAFVGGCEGVTVDLLAFK